MRVIIDANVAIAAVASRGLCEALLELCLEHHQVVLCAGILEEIEEKLARKLKVPSSVIADYLHVLRANAEILEPERVEKSVCRDPDDLMVLGLVGPGRAEVIITGDADLLVLERFKTARIVSPRTFWERSKRTE